MTTVLRACLLAAFAGLPLAAAAQGYDPRFAPRGVDVTGSVGGRAPWSPPYEYDTGGDFDRRPELPVYQQGGGQKTGGPARNLIPDDGIHISPRSFPR